MNPKREVRTPKFKMRVVGAGRGKGSYKRQKSNSQKWSKGE
jgi:stalled ribosome alternative rescue factor ArfA